MKQKVNILCPLIRLGLFFLLISVPQLLFAQEDSIRITHDNVPIKSENLFQLPTLGPSLEKTAGSLLHSSKQLYKLPNFSLKEKMYLPYETNLSPLFRGDYRTDGLVKKFSHGALFGSGQQTSIPGIGRINNASLGYQHLFSEKLTLEFRANAMKINMAHFAGQTFSASGTLLYRPSDRIAFKAFGSYDLGNPYGMSTHHYGVTMSVDMSERFGMEMGVQRYYDAMRGRWETVPVVIPYYHFDKFTLGLDVGGLLYEILRDVIFEKPGSGNPTIAPPRLSIPIR